jgi:ABC-type multidrug transport system permease subunit
VSIVLSILLAVTIGLLLGILIGNRQQLVILSQVMLIPLIGPILLRIFSDLLPTWLNKLAGWLPTAAMFDLLRISFSNQSDAGLVLPRLAVLAIYCLALLGTSASLIQRRER